jgi:hypothetical protein
MPFTIAATSSDGAISVDSATAKEALAKFMEFEESGFQKITVKDNLGRRLTLDQLLLLSSGPS